MTDTTDNPTDNPSPYDILKARIARDTAILAANPEDNETAERLADAQAELDALLRRAPAEATP